MIRADQVAAVVPSAAERVAGGGAGLGALRGPRLLSTDPVAVTAALRAEAAEIVRLVRRGAKVMVCGGRGMAAGVSAALTDILAPAGLTPALLKVEGRYVEDVY